MVETCRNQSQLVGKEAATRNRTRQRWTHLAAYAHGGDPQSENWFAFIGKEIYERKTRARSENLSAKSAEGTVTFMEHAFIGKESRERKTGARSEKPSAKTTKGTVTFMEH